MKVHIAETVEGIFACDEGGRELWKRTFPPAERLKKIEQIISGEPTAEHLQLIEELSKRGYTVFVLESKEMLARLTQRFPNLRFEVAFPNPAGKLARKNLSKLPAKQVSDIASPLVLQKIRHELGRSESIVALGVRVMENIEKHVNAIASILFELYLHHFPEIEDLSLDLPQRLKIISIGSRHELQEAGLEEFGQVGSKILEMASHSVGSELNPDVLQLMKSCAKNLLEALELKQEIEKQLGSLMSEIAPNTSAILGGVLAAKMLSKVGGLEELGRMTASHLQVLGAEKALFRALKTKGKRPKHGLIFLHPLVRGAPKKVRGKIARALANKLAIAARVDATTKRFIGDELSADLQRKVEEILHGEA